jgi:DHA2 family multidrug resistance protein-like MFS transporter
MPVSFETGRSRIGARAWNCSAPFFGVQPSRPASAIVGTPPGRQFEGMTDPTPTAADDGIPMPQRIWAVLAISIGIVMAMLDGAIANVALPSIAQALHASASASVWVVNGYQLSVAVLLLPLSAVAEIVGLRRVFWTGLLVFTVASAACGMASNLTWLVGARMLQGVGSACIFSTYPALIAHIYPRHILGRGIGISATIVALAGALGPTVSAGILSITGWEWLFFVNVPVGIAGLVIGQRALPQTGRSQRRFDLPAALLSAVVIALLVIGVDGLGQAGRRPLALAEIAAAVALGTWLLRSQGRQNAPLVPVDLLRIPLFGLSVGTSVCSYAAQVGVFVALPFMFQQVLGWSAVATGLVMTPIPLAVAAIGTVAGRLADRYPAGVLCGIGLLVMAAGLASLAQLTGDPGIPGAIWRESLVGLGFGLFQAPNNRTLLSAGPRNRAGSAGGMLATARLLGQSVGASVVAVIFALGGDVATRRVLAAACAIALVGAAISFLRLAAPGPVAGRTAS